MIRMMSLLLAAGVLLPAGQLYAHDTPNMAHTHAFKQTGYGTYRQGHSVNGPNGSIIMFSPRNYSGYQSAPNVRFARPEPITRAPGSSIPNAKIASDPARSYGKQQKSDYGN